MTSPAPLYLSLDTHRIFGVFTAPAAAEAVILAVLGITSRFMHADHRVPPRCSLPARTCSGFPRRAGLWERFALPANPRGATTGRRARCCADSPDGKSRHHLSENPDERRAV
jgi:hypothetical protein